MYDTNKMKHCTNMQVKHFKQNESNEMRPIDIET